MAKFYASIKGGRGEATRMGHSEIMGHIRSWNVGVSVWGHLTKDGKVEFEVYETGGSNNPTRETLVATITEREAR